MGKKGKARGKQPTGRAAQRGKAQKSEGWQQNFQFVEDTDENPQRTFRGFSQGNPHNSSQNTPNAKLRHQAISFVSAASAAPVDEEQEQSFVQEAIALAAEQEEGSDEEDEEGEAEEDFDDSNIQLNLRMDTDIEISEGGMAQMNIHSSTETTGLDTDGTSDAPSAKPSSPETLPFFVDTAGDTELQLPKAIGKRPIPRSPSPALSDSSEEEVVVFHGRGRNARPTVVNDPVVQQSKPLASQQSKPSVSQPSHTPHITDGLLAALAAPSELPQSSASSPLPTFSAPSPLPTSSAAPAKGWAAKPKPAPEPAGTWQAAPSIPYWKKGKQRPDLDPSPEERMLLDEAPPRVNKVMFVEPERDAEDTIASLQADAKKLGLGASSSPKGNRRGKRGRRKDNRQLRSAIVSDDENDEEAAYEDYMENLKAQLDADALAFTSIDSIPVAEAGPSLVVDGKEIADGDVLDQEDEWEDDSSESEGPIGQDLSDLSSDGALNCSDLEMSDLEDELEYTERQQFEDEEDLRQRRKAAKSDEQIARLLAKQYELGMGDNELLIDDGRYVDDYDDGVGDVDQAIAGLREITNSSFGRSANKHGMRRTRRSNGDFSFPDASALADSVEQYGENGFDIMDFERPSLRPKNKGRKAKLPPELDDLSDEELKDEMLSTWEKDRSKKRLKKAEREELRQQGLLGAAGRKGKADLGQKYLEGMTMEQVYEELRIFLQDDMQSSRPFPPMAKNDRAALHIVAEKLNLKSKSVGSGNNRLPILYKTKFTIEYHEAHFNKLMHASSRGFLKNSSNKGKKFAKAANNAKGRAGRGGGFDKTGTALRNGEVVGAGAAEIGRESVGHKLMEKMGWSKGMALGKEGEGMLLPVQQVMRAGKAGLG